MIVFSVMTKSALVTGTPGRHFHLLVPFLIIQPRFTNSKPRSLAAVLRSTPSNSCCETGHATHPRGRKKPTWKVEFPPTPLRRGFLSWGSGGSCHLGQWSPGSSPGLDVFLVSDPLQLVCVFWASTAPHTGTRYCPAWGLHFTCK